MQYHDNFEITEKVKGGPGSLGGPQDSYRTRSFQKVGAHPVRNSKINSEQSENKHGQRPHSNVDTASSDKTQTNILTGATLNHNRECSSVKGLEKRFSDYKGGSKAAIDFMQKIADKATKIGQAPKAVPNQPRPETHELEVWEMQLTNLVRKYELELSQWERSLSFSPACSYNRVQDMDARSKVRVMTEAKRGSMISNGFESALSSYRTRVYVLCKKLKYYKKENDF